MRQKTLIAFLLILIGIFALAYEGVTYKTREKTMDLGSLEVTAEKTKRIPIPPIVGASL